MIFIYLFYLFIMNDLPQKRMEVLWEDLGSSFLF
jgi:hypothetical protein